MQSMPFIASCVDLDSKRLQLQCGSQNKPLGSLRWNLQVEGINRGGSRGCGGCISSHQQFSTMLRMNKNLS